MKNIKKLIDQVQKFMLQEMKAGSNLQHLEKFERDWADWKAKNDFPRSYDPATVMGEIENKLTEQPSTSDERIPYNYVPIECNGTTVHFTGKGDRKTSTLKVYQFYGDITLFEQAMQDFCLVNHYNTCKPLFPY